MRSPQAATYGSQWSDHKAERPPMSSAHRFFIVVFKNESFRFVRPSPSDSAQLTEMMATGELWFRSADFGLGGSVRKILRPGRRRTVTH
jgi:hypothetical protein